MSDTAPRRPLIMRLLCYSAWCGAFHTMTGSYEPVIGMRPARCRDDHLNVLNHPAYHIPNVYVDITDTIEGKIW